MRVIAFFLIIPFFLTGCDFLNSINAHQFPEQQRGVADGVKLGQRSLKDLQKYGVVIADTREGTVVILPADNVFRETIDRVTINPDYQPILNELVYILKGYPKVNFSVIGHTDGVMTNALEEKLSSQYAYAVANYLTSAGISPMRITAVRGVASSQPIDRNKNVDARALNRRVEIITQAPIK